MANLRIKPSSVQETLVIPLYGRKLCAEQFPKLYQDGSAAKACAQIDYDFSDLDRHAASPLWQFGALEAAMRQLDMQWEVRDYLASHPHAAVVNMGCGLDQTGRACDNGRCKLYNVDMPDVINMREQLFPTDWRETDIKSNLNDHAWMEQVDGSDGAVFFAAGVFHYLTTWQAQTLASELARRFPGGRLVFDTIGRLGRLLMRRTFKSFGMENYRECLCVQNPRELKGWVSNATVSSKGYMLGYHAMDDPAVTALHRFLARRCDGMLGMRVNRIDFPGTPDSRSPAASRKPDA